MIFIREKQLSPPQPRISIRTQVGGDKMGCLVVLTGLLLGNGYFARVVLFNTEGNATSSVLGPHFNEKAEAQSNAVTCPRTYKWEKQA